MKKLNKYESLEAYNMTSNRDDDTTNVSLIAGKSVIDAVNTVIPIQRGLMRIGDHLVFDKQTGKRMVVRHYGFNKNLLNSRFVDGKAVYFGDIGDKAYFVGVKRLNNAFSQYSRCKLTGFDLANGGTAKLTASNFACEFTYSVGTTYEEIAAAMTAAKSGSYKSYVQFVALEDGIGMKTWPTNLTVVSGGLSIEWLKAIKADGTEVTGKVSWDTVANYCDFTEVETFGMDMRGLDNTVIVHKKQYIEYIRTLSSATTFGDEYSEFMNQATFNSCEDGTVGGADGIALYNKYGGNYYDYADVCASMRLINYDVPYKVAETLRTGEKATKEFAGVKMYDFDGTLLDAFPAAVAANAYGITTDGFVTGFEAGNWHQLGVGELSRIMRLATSKTATLDADDILNKAIVAGGGSPIISNTSYTLCLPSSIANSLFFQRVNGTLSRLDPRVVSRDMFVSLTLDYEKP